MERLTHKARYEAGYRANKNVHDWECVDKLGQLEDLEEQGKLLAGWIPVRERLPEDDSYILVSFENFSVADIARYETDEDGSAFYPGDEDKSYVSLGLFVNAWMPLPEPYRPEK